MLKILAISPTCEDVTMVTDENNSNLWIFTNGKMYSTSNYRPIDGNGRQLREDKRTAADLILSEALEALEAERQTAAPVIEYVEKVVEVPVENPRSNFADALQDAFLKTLTEKAGDNLLQEVLPVAVAKLETEITERFGVLPQIHRVEIPTREPVELQGVMHKDFDRILSIIMDNEPVYLCGPAGTGKSFLAQQVAKALNLEYYYTNSVTDDIQLKGFIDANGRYHGTQFHEAFTNGGLFLMDELDASVPETLVLLNNALANGYFDFPTGRATAHEDFRCMAAGNTCGTGADDTYTGRYHLDGASMDRFAMVKVDYDKAVELAIASNDSALVDFCEDFRKAVSKVGMNVLCTYRAIKRLSKFSAYMDKGEALRMALIKGIPADDVTIILGSMTVENDWTAALKSLTY